VRIAHLSDLHVTRPGDPAFGRLDTNPFIANAIDAVNSFTPAIDVVIITGDLTNNGVPEEYEILGRHLARLEVPYFAVPGNHDDSRTMSEELDGPWDKGAALDYAVDFDGLRFIGLDSSIPGEDRGELSRAQLTWLDHCLAEDADRPAIVFFHHPPFTTGLEFMDGIGLSGKDELAAVLARHPEVLAVCCGHLHRTIVSQAGSRPAYTAPGVAHAVALDLRSRAPLTLAFEPPGFLLHLWTPGEARLLTHAVLIPQGQPFDVLAVVD
jgi:3',5'-cyclic-AMP phosphodiesterase